LPQLTREEPLDELRLVPGRGGEEFVEELSTSARRSAARRGLNVGDRAVQVEEGERRFRGRALFGPVHARVADADPPLPRDAREKADDDRNLVGVEPS
jgi:hypothetical protein